MQNGSEEMSFVQNGGYNTRYVTSIIVGRVRVQGGQGRGESVML
jgi:hypothetical protein